MSRENIDRFLAGELTKGMQAACFTREENLAFQREMLAGWEEDLASSEEELDRAIGDLARIVEQRTEEREHIRVTKARIAELERQ